MKKTLLQTHPHKHILVMPISPTKGSSIIFNIIGIGRQDLESNWKFYSCIKYAFCHLGTTKLT